MRVHPCRQCIYTLHSGNTSHQLVCGSSLLGKDCSRDLSLIVFLSLETNRCVKHADLQSLTSAQRPTSSCSPSPRRSATGSTRWKPPHSLCPNLLCKSSMIAIDATKFCYTTCSCRPPLRRTRYYMRECHIFFDFFQGSWLRNQDPRPRRQQSRGQ